MADVNLGSNEQAVLLAASQVFSGFVASGILNANNREKTINYSLSVALDMAIKIDQSTKVESFIEGETPFPS